MIDIRKDFITALEVALSGRPKHEIIQLKNQFKVFIDSAYYMTTGLDDERCKPEYNISKDLDGLFNDSIWVPNGSHHFINIMDQLKLQNAYYNLFEGDNRYNVLWDIIKQEKYSEDYNKSL